MDEVRTPVLDVRGLEVRFDTYDRPVHAVRGVDFHVHAGEVLGVIGESGCGKSATALAVMGLLPRNGSVQAGTVCLNGRDLRLLRRRELERVRGREMAMIFQDPQTSLNPVVPVGRQIEEPMAIHEDLSGTERRRRAVELMDMVGIADAASRYDHYPHQFSGGMCQRVMIAMALACRPRLILADEPTTGLDVTVQAQFLELMKSLCSELGVAMVLITHDLGVVAGIADRVAVMYAGKVVERGGTDGVFAAPRHPYTNGLLACLPRLDVPGGGDRLVSIDGAPPDLRDPPRGCGFAERCAVVQERCRVDVPELAPIDTGAAVACFVAHDAGDSGLAVGKPSARETSPPPPAADAIAPEEVAGPAGPLLELRDVAVHFPADGGLVRRPTSWVRAVDGIDVTMAPGETLGIVGESGCGKSTAARAALQLHRPTRGSVRFEGIDLSTLPRRELRSARRRMQLIFQDPYGSLDPRMPVRRILSEPLRIHRVGRRGSERTERVAHLLELVGLPPDAMSRYPHQFSGGQRQRIGIARALAVEPSLVVCDEAVSALDVSVRAQIVNLLEDLQRRLGLAYLFIAHDLGIVRHMADRVAVMYLGRIVEVGDTATIYDQPAHPYTQALLSAVPVPDPPVERRRRRILLQGEIPSPVSPPSGCRFRTRCPIAEEVCTREDPPLIPHPSGQSVACHFAGRAVEPTPVSLSPVSLSPVSAGRG